MEFVVFVIGAVFISQFLVAGWLCILIGCLFEFLRCVLCFRFVGIPERLDKRSKKIKKWCYDLMIMAADAFSVDENI